MKKCIGTVFFTYWNAIDSLFKKKKIVQQLSTVARVLMADDALDLKRGHQGGVHQQWWAALTPAVWLRGRGKMCWCTYWHTAAFSFPDS